MLEASGNLAGYQPAGSHAADLLRRLGRHADAVDAYRTAIALATTDAERRYLTRRLAESARDAG